MAASEPTKSWARGDIEAWIKNKWNVTDGEIKDCSNKTKLLNLIQSLKQKEKQQNKEHLQEGYYYICNH